MTTTGLSRSVPRPSVRRNDLSTTLDAIISGAGGFITHQDGDGNEMALPRVEISGSAISSIRLDTPQRMQAVGQGIPFVTCPFEAAATLNSPIPWIPIATNSAKALGSYEFIDVHLDNGITLCSARSYGAQSP